MTETAIEDLYQMVVRSWNDKNANAYAALFVEHGMKAVFSQLKKAQGETNDHLDRLIAPRKSAATSSSNASAR